ncbi:MAG: hypothetical protein U1F08_12615 [Steroidobacteraceae bacterium]
MTAPALLAGLVTLGLAGCGKSTPEAAAPPAADLAEVPAAAVPPAPDKAAEQAAEQAAALAAKEQELADREAALKQQEIEAELQKRELEAQAQQQAAAAAAAKKAAAKPKPAPAQVAAAQPAKPAAPPPPPPPIIVPAGTPLSITVTSAVSTKTAAVGNRIQGQLASDVVVGGRRAAAAGTPVSGVITQVVSGSKKIGGTPVLAVNFDTLDLGGRAIAIGAPLSVQGKSDTAKDTAKVIGTGAAGAVIGHQISHKNGAIVGGILGTAGGLAIAQKTGGEVEIASGTVVNVTLTNGFEVAGN